ncbi:Phospholipase D1 [Zalaria obscura]|uniref:Phospholipase D1 n=1 Tax=Zalaria obscura TaxID=2024903 RepID=A0ACC3SMW6_9PEZI
MEQVREESVPSSADRSPRSSSPVTRPSKGKDVAREANGHVTSPLRAAFSPEGAASGQRTEGASMRPNASHSVRFGTTTAPDYFTSAPNGSLIPELPPDLEPPPRDILSRHESDPTLARKATNASGTATPPDRRSVQFARSVAEGSPSGTAAHSRSNTWELDESEEAGKSRQGSIFARLRALAAPTNAGSHSRNTSAVSGWGSMTPTVLMTPASERSEPRWTSSHGDGSEAEGDVDESSGEENAPQTADQSKTKQKRKKERDNGASAPTTPRNARFPSFLRESPFASGSATESKSHRLQRRATMTDIPEDSRAGVSEDEGRERLKSAWRRGLEGARGLSYGQHKRHEGETPEGKRPGNLRRFTGIANLDGSSASPFRMKADRHNSTSAQKWRQVKAGLKLLGQRKKDERIKVDHQKSAELMAELLAGSPAALLFASMYQRDEHGRKKIPVLLEQLKIRITHSQTKESKSGDRHMVFTINLEYGSGPSRMAWTIHRTLRDFANLHLKYKLQGQTERYIQLKGEDRKMAKMPHFPRSAFPYLRGVRGLADESEPDDDDNALEASGPDGEASGNERPSQKKRRLSSYHMHRRRSSTAAAPDTSNGDAPRSGSIAGGAGGNSKPRELYSDRQRKKLETYLQQMIRWLIFRPDSTRLCKFLELSALAMRLSVEGGYHGKEGLMTIVSRRTQRIQHLRPLRASQFAPAQVTDRHKPKWFLVRHSYLVCVDSPESLEPREVFLVDSDFRTEKQKKPLGDQSAKELAKNATESATQSKHHVIRLYNAERKLKLLAKNERQLAQFKESIEQMQKNTIWSQRHRFDSFAPIRKGVFARWMVDGRDHMWQVSRAIDNARNFVYIHDWWLSPELYMRRPPAISQKWRLDRLLQRKAQEGVKIFVIVYRNIESAIPIDSEYTKASLLDLHPNIHVQRSPNQFRQNQFFWAHHEKLVVVDNAMAFVGGIDLCFGRWDEPSHSLTDDKLTGFELDSNVPRDSEHCQVWPGKDYSNPRVQDFYALDKPYEEMYDRTKVPRMPWHDISMTVVGQPARDVGRHFVQRWNYILRQRVPSRPTPILLPPPEYEEGELERLGMTGTCQIQILRSCTTWSIGTPNKTECSIMNAYVTLIQQSQHFVYIENQFFVTSCTVEGTPILNKIGDALVERIEAAYERGDKWRACIIIPLMPGFQNSVDAQDGTSVRLIMQCQYRSICRGETSIFGRLRAKGIDPEDYIEFYALRQWGKIGPLKCLTTEQLYIHAKCMIVDDRSCIIGSANINERSMLGSRDSEVASIVTDQEMIPSYMGGEPFEVGTFPHTLRMRLMREHLGLDVDEIYHRDNASDYAGSMDSEMEHIYREDFATPPATPPAQGLTEQNLAAGRERTVEAPVDKERSLKTWIHKAGIETQDHAPTEDMKDRENWPQHERDVAGTGADNMTRIEAAGGDTGGRDSFVDARGREVLASTLSHDNMRGRFSSVHADGISRITSGESKAHDTWSYIPPSRLPRMNTAELGLTQLSQLPPLPVTDDTDIGGPPLVRKLSKSSAGHVVNPLLQSMRRPVVEEDCMKDPLVDSFYCNIWHKVAENNTKLYRQVFRCMPDSEVQSWPQYRQFNEYNERFMQSQGLGQSKPKTSKEAPAQSGPPGSGADPLSAAGLNTKLASHASKHREKVGDLTNKLLRPHSNSSSRANGSIVAEDQITEKQRQGSQPSDKQTTAFPDADFDEKAAAQRSLDDVTMRGGDAATGVGVLPTRTRTIQYSDEKHQKHNEKLDHAPETTATQSEKQTNGGLQHSNSTTTRRRRRATTKSSAKPFYQEEVLEKDDAEELLKLVQGHLVLWPYDWLEKEEKGGNWLYNIDQIAPLEI